MKERQSRRSWKEWGHTNALRDKAKLFPILARAIAKKGKTASSKISVICNRPPSNVKTAHLFAFYSQEKDNLKILHWDKNGFGLYSQESPQASPSKFYSERKQIPNCCKLFL